MKKATFILALLSLMIVFTTGQALASSASSVATLDLSSLYSVITFTSGNTPGPAPATYAQASDDNSPGNQIPPVNTLDPSRFNTMSVPGIATATATLDATSPILNKFSATTSVSENSITNPISTAGAQDFGTWIYNGATGIVSVAVPYTSSYSVSASSGATSFASANTYFYILLKSTSATSLLNQFFGNTIYAGTAAQTDIDNSNSAYKLSLFLTHGQTGTYQFYVKSDASASAPVPIPAAIWLLGSGIVGLAGIRRKLFN
jgi:hypothetical protein